MGCKGGNRSWVQEFFNTWVEVTNHLYNWLLLSPRYYMQVFNFHSNIIFSYCSTQLGLKYYYYSGLDQERYPKLMVVPEGNFPYIITSSESWVVWYTSSMMNWLETLVTMTIITANPPIFSAKKLSHHSGTDGGGVGGLKGLHHYPTTPKMDKDHDQGHWEEIPVRYHFDQGIDLMVNFYVTKLESKSQIFTALDNVLKAHEKRNKFNYLNH